VISTQSLLIALITFGAMQAGNVFAFLPDISSAKGATNAIIELLDPTPLPDMESPGRKLVPGEIVRVHGDIRLENVDLIYPTDSGFSVTSPLLLNRNLCRLSWPMWLRQKH